MKPPPSLIVVFDPHARKCWRKKIRFVVVHELLTQIRDRTESACCEAVKRIHRKQYNARGGGYRAIAAAGRVNPWCLDAGWVHDGVWCLLLRFLWNVLPSRTGLCIWRPLKGLCRQQERHHWAQGWENLVVDDAPLLLIFAGLECCNVVLDPATGASGKEVVFVIDDKIHRLCVAAVVAGSDHVTHHSCVGNTAAELAAQCSGRDPCFDAPVSAAGLSARRVGRCTEETETKLFIDPHYTKLSCSWSDNGRKRRLGEEGTRYSEYFKSRERFPARKKGSVWAWPELVIYWFNAAPPGPAQHITVRLM